MFTKTAVLLAAVLAVAPSAGVAQSRDVSLEWIGEVFSRTTSLDVERNDDLLLLRGEGYTVGVDVHQTERLIHFFSVWSFRAGTSTQEKRALVDRLNERVKGLHFELTSDGDLMSNYAVSYEEGVTETQLKDAYSYVYLVTIAGLLAHDKDRILA